MNKKTIVEAIHLKVGFPKRECAAIVDKAFQLVTEALAEGEPVVISAFGKLSAVQREAREGRNPQTGDPIILPARKAVTFRVSRVLKERINEAHQNRGA